MSNSAYMAQYMLRRYHERRTWAISYLGGCCAVCGTDVDLELDHVDPATKKGNVAKLWSYRWERFLEEVDKCQLLCHTHHIAKTAQDAMPPHGTYWRYRKHKCRCDECCAAFRLKDREYKARSKANRGL